ncbi:DUF7937 domain-containing protein [Rhodococcoides yunnanense]|uniref:DUF7937 domain-containing protein n=1 Tax=Rhodococcoides yunnanense TaxID=278209 RepID=UPI0009324F51
MRDGVAGILLFVSFFLPWTTEFGIARGGSGGIIALVVLLTLLSLSIPNISAPQGIPRGWYPDPQNPNMFRWFEGFVWTDSTSPRG